MRSASIALLAFLGCASPTHSSDWRAVAGPIADRNRDRLPQLEPGITLEGARQIMVAAQAGDVAAWPSANPWKSESLRNSEGHTVLIDFYLTDPAEACPPGREAHVPVVFVESRLAGVGWAYLEDQYVAWGKPNSWYRRQHEVLRHCRPR